MDVVSKKTDLGAWLRGIFSRDAAATQLAPGQPGAPRDRLGQVVRITLLAFAALAVAYLISTLVLARNMQAQTRQSVLANSVQEFAIDLGRMRTNSANFINNPAMDFVDLFKKSHDSALANLNAARNNPQANVQDVIALNEMEKELENYYAGTMRLVDAQVKAGLNETQGQQGTVRKAAQDLEANLRQAGDREALTHLLFLRQHEKDFLLSGQPRYLNTFNQQIKDMKATLQGAAAPLLQAYDKGFQDLAASEQIKSRELVAARAGIVALETQIPQLLAESAQRSKRSSNVTLLTLLGTGLVLVGALIGLGLLLLNVMRSANATLAERLMAQQKAEAENEQLNDSVISILEAVNQLSQRDLTAKAPVSQDIIGTVSDSINQLTDETARVLHGVTGIAGQVESVSNNVKHQADQVRLGAIQARAGVEQMVESLFSATQTMNQVAALAEQGNTSAEQATAATDTALSTVSDTVGGMESIRETIAETEKRIKRLGERSQEISGIVNLINTISERTHVLALNASMQAAVAGEAGRGFAVVAEEVQRLAESSRNATQQIATLVNNIQIETNETINTVNRTIGQVVQGSEQAQKAGEQMRVTQGITAQLVAQVRNIAQASDLQKAMSADLLASAQRIGENAEQAELQIEAQDKQTDSLLAAARQLVESVNVFKLPPQQMA